MCKQIILLNGASSSGKSTLAKALQAKIGERRNERYEIVSIDDFLNMKADEAIYEDDVFEISGRLCERVAEALFVGCLPSENARTTEPRKRQNRQKI